MRTFLGLLLVVPAVAAGVVGVRRWRFWAVVRQVKQETPDQLVNAARLGHLRPAVRAVVGTAAPDSHGELISTVNHERCVWHRHTVVVRQMPSGGGGRGKPPSRRSARANTGDWSSSEPFHLVGRHEQIVIHPGAMPVDRPARCEVKLLAGLASKPFPSEAELMLANSIQFLHREWVIRAGTPLYVLGEVSHRDGRIILKRPVRGPALISTRPAAQLVRQTRTAAITALGFAAVLLLAATLVLTTNLP